MPKVFYASRTRSVTPPSAAGSDESGSEASTDVEVPSRRRLAHRRGESVDASLPDPKRARVRTARDAQGRRALQKACQRNDLERVRSILSQNVDIEDRDYAGTTALHEAALNGSAAIVRLLLQHGAVVDVRSGLEELDTPLMDAVAAGSIEVTRLLLDAGADPRVTNAVGKTAVDFVDEEDDSAGAIGELLERATRALRTAGAPVVDSPSHPRAPPTLFPPGYEARKRVTPTNFIDVTRRTGRVSPADAVEHAAEGNLAFVGLALERGWDPSPEALVKAAKFGHTEVVGLLLAFGLHADAAFDGQTALKAAVLRGHVATAQLLLQSGADPARRDARGRTSFDLVADLPAKDPMRALIESTKKGSGAASGDARASDDVHGSGHAQALDDAHPLKSEDGQKRPTAPSVARPPSPDSASDNTESKGARPPVHQASKLAAEKRATEKHATEKHATEKHATEKRATEKSAAKDLAHVSSRSSVSRPSLKTRQDGTSSESRSVSWDDGSAGVTATDKKDPSGGTHALPADATARATETAGRLGDPKVVQRSESRSESRSEPRREAFRLADLRAIKPKKRSKSVPDPGHVIKLEAGDNEAAASARSSSDSVAPSVPAPESAGPSESPVSEPVASAAADPSAIDTSAHAVASVRESPSLSPLTEAPREKARTPDVESPRWVERSNELAELAKRKEKQRLAREARMLQSLAHEERRRSQEPLSPMTQSPTTGSPASQSPVHESSVADQQPLAPARAAASAALSGASPSSTTPPAPVEQSAESPSGTTAAEEPVSEPVSVEHLPPFLQELAITGEPQNVGPLFVHHIGAEPYYLDVQVAALVGDPRLHARYPSLPRVLVADAHKPLLWTFCRPWAAGRPESAAAVSSAEAAFTSLPLAWVSKRVVDDRVFDASPPQSVNIQLVPPKPVSKWAVLFSDTDLPLRLQLRATLAMRSSEW